MPLEVGVAPTSGARLAAPLAVAVAEALGIAEPAAMAPDNVELDEPDPVPVAVGAPPALPVAVAAEGLGPLAEALLVAVPVPCPPLLPVAVSDKAGRCAVALEVCVPPARGAGLANPLEVAVAVALGESAAKAPEEVALDAPEPVPVAEGELAALTAAEAEQVLLPVAEAPDSGA